MATIPYTAQESFTLAYYVDVVTWTGLNGATSDVGQAWLAGPNMSSGCNTDKCVQFIGDSAGNASLEGTNDATPANWQTLTSPGDVLLTSNSATARLLQQVLQNPLLVRPRVQAGAANVTVILVSKRPRA
jgi:hypothetical protein